MIVANSLSKNFSLYGERRGALSIGCQSAAQAERVLGQLTATIRANYSNPPMHGAGVVAEVVGDAGLRALWEWELRVMRNRIHEMRRASYEGLAERVDEECEWANTRFTSTARISSVERCLARR